MRLTDDITIQPAPAHGAVPRSEICIVGKPTGCRVAGRVLEAAVEVGGRYLVFLTEGVPMEELLSIHLISADGRLLDTASVGQIYSPGIFADLALAPPCEVRFRFLGDVQWTVEVQDSPRRAWPLGGEVPAVTRPFSFQRWFRVHATPER